MSIKFPALVHKSLDSLEVLHSRLCKSIVVLTTLDNPDLLELGLGGLVVQSVRLLCRHEGVLVTRDEEEWGRDVLHL